MRGLERDGDGTLLTEPDSTAEFSPEDPDEESPEKLRNLTAFFLFGLVNNFAYVVFLSAAEHIFEDHSGAVLFVNATPGLILKLSYGFGIYTIPYVYRICAVSLVPFAMFFVVANASSTAAKLLAIAFVSLIGGLGESSFLSMTATYSRKCIGAWSSGTGGAGIFGAGFYLLMTVVLGFSPQTTLRLSSPFPLMLAATYLFVLTESTRRSVTEAPPRMLSLRAFREKMPLLRWLFRRYLLPLMLVYYFEYTINQGVLPVIDFVSFGRLHPQDSSREETMGDKPRNWNIYVAYQLLYQVGVFISRSSISIVKIKRLWLLTLLQMLNLCFLLIVAAKELLHSAWLMFGIVVWEGLLGGASRHRGNHPLGHH
mmetsp:Transcript_6453/g.19561  ORF Transcript_6453/g.19561 Transcript_6453/m.19561 type:complete len:369 (-) Transcript_6453:298-1404(-)